jgi:hypothetical protein
MRLLILLLLGQLILLSNQIFGQQFDTIYGNTLVVLTETNPWLMVIGSDVPTFALYEKGQVIYKKEENKIFKIYEVVLTQEELQEVIQSLSISDSIYTLPDYIEASDWSDMPSNILILNIKKPKIISVYGGLNERSESREKTPKEFLTVYDNIKKYKNKSAKEWLPHKFEIMIWDYSYSPHKRPWIKGFPDLNSPGTVQHEDGSYSMFIDIEKLDDFKKYYLAMGEKEAVEINGKKMSISYTISFPNIK